MPPILLMTSREQIAALHAVIDALEHGGDHVAAVVAVRA